MSDFRVLNLEEGMPPCDEAMKLLKNRIDIYKRDKVGCVLIIHGYGSTGTGGKIREKAREWLEAQKRKGVIKDIICGEDFNLFNDEYCNLKKKYKELEEHGTYNPGITAVEL